MTIRRLRCLAGTALVSLVPALATAQSAVEVLRQGDNVLGVGNIATVEFSAINDYGEWLVLVDTANQNESADFALVRNGFLTLQEGNQLVGPIGARLDEFDTPVTINNAGATGWALSTQVYDLMDPEAAPYGSAGIYFNTKPLFVQLQNMNVPGYSANAKWLNFRLGTVRINDLNELLVACEVQDGSIPGASDSVLILARVDATGNLIEAHDVLHESGAAPGFPTLAIDKISSGFPTMAMNNVGDIMYQGRRVDPVSGNARGRVIWLNETPLIKEGDVSPVEGLLYSSLTDESIDLNDRRDYAFTATVSAPANRNRCLIKNNKTLIARERFPIEAIPNLLMGDFTWTSSVKVPNTGDVVWFGEWSGPNATNSGICVNQEIVVRRGTTIHDDLKIDLLTGSPALFDVSPNGRYLIYRATLETDLASAAVVDLGRVTPVQDCGSNGATLRRARGFAVAGKTVTFGLDEGQALGVTPFLLVSTRRLDPDAPCGLPLPYGELVIDFGNGNPFMILIGTPWGGSGHPVNINLQIANNPLLINQKVYAQGIFFDVGNQSPAPAFSMTNAVEIEIGTP